MPVFEMGTGVNPVDIARAGVEEARKRKADVVIVDTAGRLQVCECVTMLSDLQMCVTWRDVHVWPAVRSHSMPL